jgi:hypothetical protein
LENKFWLSRKENEKTTHLSENVAKMFLFEEHLIKGDQAIDQSHFLDTDGTLDWNKFYQREMIRPYGGKNNGFYHISSNTEKIYLFQPLIMIQ